MDGATEPVVAIIGQSIPGNPTQFALEAAFRQARIDCRVLSLNVKEDHLAEALDGLAAMNFLAVIPDLDLQPSVTKLMGWDRTREDCVDVLLASRMRDRLLESQDQIDPKCRIYLPESDDSKGLAASMFFGIQYPLEFESLTQHLDSVVEASAGSISEQQTPDPNPGVELIQLGDVATDSRWYLSRLKRSVSAPTISSEIQTSVSNTTDVHQPEKNAKSSDAAAPSKPAQPQKGADSESGAKSETQEKPLGQEDGDLPSSDAFIGNVLPDSVISESPNRSTGDPQLDSSDQSTTHVWRSHRDAGGLLREQTKVQPPTLKRRIAVAGTASAAQQTPDLQWLDELFSAVTNDSLRSGVCLVDGSTVWDADWAQRWESAFRDQGLPCVRRIDLHSSLLQQFIQTISGKLIPREVFADAMDEYLAI